MRLRNRCTKCGSTIPWRKKAHFGNRYKPVVCTKCSDAMRVRIYGSVRAADLAYARAARDLTGEPRIAAKGRS